MIELTRETAPEWVGEQLNNIPIMPKFESRRGIVMVAGGDKYWTNAYVSIRLLREKQCKLPIQCWYLGKKEENLIIQDLLKEYNVECIDARAFNESLPEEERHTNLNGWECKPFAIIHSPFRHAWYSDADVFYDSDGEYFFDSLQYKTYGALFWPDFNRLQKGRDIWQLTGVEFRDEKEIESGIIFVDKERCWNPLNLTNKLCEVGTRFGWFGSHGDKCLFQMAWHRCHADYFINPVDIFRLAGTMGQHDIEGKLWGLHRNMRKLNLLENEKVKNFPNEDKMFNYIDELKSYYNPYRLENEDPETRSLAGTTYIYVRLGIDQRRLIFGASNTIIQGRQRMETSYSVRDGKLHLLDDKGGITAVFEKWDNGRSWIGRWLNHEKAVCILLREDR